MKDNSRLAPIIMIAIVILVGIIIYIIIENSNRTNLLDSHYLGNPDAEIVMVEYSSFSCGYCAKYHTETYPTIKRDYIDTDKVLYVFRHYPIGTIGYSAAEASECAGEQDSFWEYHTELFKNQREWSQQTRIDPFLKYAKEIGIDQKLLQDCIVNRTYKNKVESDRREGERLGVEGTPTFFINNKKIIGAQKLEVFEEALK